MKKIVVLLVAVVSVAGAAAAGAIAHPQAMQAKTVTVVMHDPGCHWFSVGGKLQTKLTVSGPVKLFNVDEAALKVAGPNGVKVEKVGQPLLLGKGVYKITMVGQASDDNHLKLTVT
jgi:hypothetical protein